MPTQEWLDARRGDPVACREQVVSMRVAVPSSRARSAAISGRHRETFLRVFRIPDSKAGRRRRDCTTPSGRRGRTRRRRSVASRTTAPEAIDPSNVEQDADGDATDELVRRTLAALPEKYRQPLVYAAIDGLDYDTIATMLGIPVGTVKTNIHRGKQLLRERLEGSL
jgi:RNA polymerase sigma-70 factor (ECF subfamily)